MPGLVSHFKKVDHWTFLIALGLIAGNIFYQKQMLDILALLFMVIALVYDAYEEMG